MMDANTKVSLPEGAELGKFTPVAYFDKYMDCIRVITHDRSVTEHRINEFFTILENNNPSSFDPAYVGFTIKGVNQLFNSVGLSHDHVYKLADLIDLIVKHRPGSVLSETMRLVAQQYQSLGDIQVELKAA